MKRQSGTGEKEAGTRVSLVPANTVLDREGDIHRMIARHAYQLFQARGGEHGHDHEDWLAAECEVLRPCRYRLRESADAIVCAVDLPVSFTADQLKVKVEANRVMVHGERHVATTVLDGSGTHTESRPQRIFELLGLPAKVDPAKSTATLKNDTLVVAMPKVAAVATANTSIESALTQAMPATRRNHA